VLSRRGRLDASSANEILDRDSAGWHPMMLRIRAETVAVRGGAMPEHDASDAVARRCRQMPWVAAFVIDECRHERASPDCNDRVTITILRTNARSGRPLFWVRAKVGEQAAAQHGVMTARYPEPLNARSLRSLEQAAKWYRACDLWTLDVTQG
jgi:hypothetical protein